MSGTFRTMAWEGDALLLLDQRVLPVLESMRRCADPSSVADAIRTMVVRGAPDPLLRPALRGGRPVGPPSPPRAIRDRVLRQVERFHAREGRR